jgi:hypothetical protein
MAIKSKFAFLNNCYKELLNLISDVLPMNHTMPKDMYQSKKLLSTLGMEYEKIDVCKDNCMIFYKEHKNETKCLKCTSQKNCFLLWVWSIFSGVDSVVQKP